MTNNNRLFLSSNDTTKQLVLHHIDQNVFSAEELQELYDLGHIAIMKNSKKDIDVSLIFWSVINFSWSDIGLSVTCKKYYNGGFFVETYNLPIGSHDYGTLELR